VRKVGAQPQLTRLPHPVRITDHNWPEGTVPVVSVLCVTYNHAKFIRDAVEGFLRQETTFPVEIIIHDDASTDGTTDLIKEYAEKFPYVIRHIAQSRNTWPNVRGIDLIQRYCRGSFVALCEGDDYWTDLQKLAVQVAFMEANIKFSFCFHQVKVVHEDDPQMDYVSNEFQKVITGIEDVIDRWYARTCSLLVRRNLLPRVPDWWYIGLGSGDIIMQLHLAANGPVYFINSVMGVYRIHANGITHGRRLESPEAVAELTYILRCFDQDTQGQYSRLVAKRIGVLHLGLAWRCREENDIQGWIWALMESLGWILRGASASVGLRQWAYCALIPSSARDLYFGACRLRKRLLERGPCAWL
jgi:hypothetical protein